MYASYYYIESTTVVMHTSTYYHDGYYSSHQYTTFQFGLADLVFPAVYFLILIIGMIQPFSLNIKIASSKITRTI